MFQGIQLALDGIHLSVDVLLGDVLISLDLLDSTPVTSPFPAARSFAISPASVGHHRPGAPALAHTPAGTDAGSQCEEVWVCREPQSLRAPGPSAGRLTPREARLPTSRANPAPFSATPEMVSPRERLTLLERETREHSNLCNWKCIRERFEP